MVILQFFLGFELVLAFFQSCKAQNKSFRRFLLQVDILQFFVDLGIFTILTQFLVTKCYFAFLSSHVIGFDFDIVDFRCCRFLAGCAHL